MREMNDRYIGSLHLFKLQKHVEVNCLKKMKISKEIMITKVRVMVPLGGRKRVILRVRPHRGF